MCVRPVVGIYGVRFKYIFRGAEIGACAVYLLNCIHIRYILGISCAVGALHGVLVRSHVFDFMKGACLCFSLASIRKPGSFSCN